VNFEDNRSFESVGKVMGFMISYFIFSIILFLILNLLNKIPESWTILQMFGITLVIVIIGAVLKKALR